MTTNNKISLALVGFIIGLSAGIFEEIGWTGFAIPELRQKYGVFTTGLILGVYGEFGIIFLQYGFQEMKMGNRELKITLLNTTFTTLNCD